MLWRGKRLPRTTPLRTDLSPSQLVEEGEGRIRANVRDVRDSGVQERSTVETVDEKEIVERKVGEEEEKNED